MSFLKHAPQFNSGEAVEIARSVYDLEVSAEALPSERDQNFLIATEAGKRFVLKIANSLEKRELLEAQNEAMRQLESAAAFCPRVVPTRSGRSIGQIVAASGGTHLVRLVTYLPGVPLAKVEKSAALLSGVGKCLGKLTSLLSSFDHAAFHRDFHWDLVNGERVINEYKEGVEPVELRELVTGCLDNFRQETGSRLSSLRRSVIHGDANDYNLIVSNDELSIGLIDFGDMIHSYTVGELAVALAYLVLDESDPLATAREVVAGYVSEWRLNDDELKSIWWLMLMRLCMSICLASHQQNQQPNNAYLDISQRSIRNSLPKLLAINPQAAAEEFRRISELTPLVLSSS